MAFFNTKNKPTFSVVASSPPSRISPLIKLQYRVRAVTAIPTKSDVTRITQTKCEVASMTRSLSAITTRMHCRSKITIHLAIVEREEDLLGAVSNESVASVERLAALSSSEASSSRLE